MVLDSASVGVCAGTAEVVSFWWRRDFPISPTTVVIHLAVLFLLGAGLGALSTALRRECAIARAWLVLPTLIVLAPHLMRRFGPWAMAAGAILLIWWAARRSHRPESMLVAGLAGATIAAHLGHFLLWEYAGRGTAMEPLMGLGTTSVVALGIYAGWSRYSSWRVASGRYAAIGVSFGATAVALGVTMVSGDVLPAALRDSSAATGRQPIVLIVLDTVRADHLSLYGYGRRTMPALSAFAARDAVVVERAISNGTDSLSGHASLFTGLFPVNHGAHRPLLSDSAPPLFGYSLRSDVPTVAEILAAHGYSTLGVTANYGPMGADSGLGLDRGFDLYRSYPDGDCEFGRASPWATLASWVRTLGVGWMSPCEVTYRRADVITDEAIALLDAAGPDGFFLFVNYFDAHSPYNPPEGFGSEFPGVDPQLGPNALLTPEVGELLTASVGLPPALERHINALYDGELRFMDSHLSRLLDRLRRHPAWNDMLVVVTADHGEALGEHSYVGHSSHLYDVIVRVPLLIRPGLGDPDGAMPAIGARWDRPMQLVDIAPLMIRHAQIGFPLQHDGRLPEAPPAPLRTWAFPSPLLLPMSSRFARELRAIEIDGWKLIEDDRGSIELYHVPTDPDETANLSEREPARVDLLRAQLGPRVSYRSETNSGEAPSAESLERLRSLGYIR